MKDLHILVKDLPDETNRLLDTLAVSHNKRKWEIIRDALIEYAERHRKDVGKALTGGKHG